MSDNKLKLPTLSRDSSQDNNTASQETGTPEPARLDNIAVYSFCPLTDAQLAEVVEECEKDGYRDENGGNKDFIAVAPKPHFLEPEAEVEKVIAYHRELEHERPGYYDPYNFIVAKSPEWKKEGVMLVVLDEGSLKSVPDDGVAYERGWDSWMFTAKSSGLSILNLQIANMDWTDITTWEDVQPEGQETDQRSGQNWYQMQGEY
ncbi:hypothetical protein K435DRAFT_776099 [Dendrothele bispora CBS 962.96]|uniref:Uncharacterized protein n=1 Tax=Dendrothele bispora (strain CBS 962.96) TaxID=1314807 RepID=A0A4S8MF48_DENBC|nr:hypothetical protein K435DRAFT_776099 [Dendrothele bispora CBS 962.96]